MTPTSSTNPNYKTPIFFPTQKEIDFFEGDDESPPGTPSKTDLDHITSQFLQKTPSPIKKTETMLQETTPDRSAISGEKRILNSLEEVLANEEQEFPLKKFRRRLFDSVSKDFLPRINGFSVSSTDHVSRHLVSVENVEDSFTACWIENLIVILKKAGLNIAVVNTGHITTPQLKHKTTGFHFCPTGHPYEKCLKQTYQSAYSAVWYAEFDAGKGPKKSSFFPRTIQTEVELLEIFVDATKLCSSKNRALFKANTNDLFYFEIFYREDIYIVSAFPIYYFALYTEGATIHLTPSLSVPMKELHSTLAALTPEEYEKLVRYTFKEGETSYTILDVASLIKDNPIEQGIYVQFECKVAPS